MIEGKRILAIVPARGGSKGLPGKNILPICGKPLISWSIDKARRSRYLDLILVTTDSEEIAGIAKESGAYVPFLRPPELASDYSSTYDAIRHALNFMEKSENQRFDYVVLLEPTSPLREDDDIDRMLEKLLAHQNEFDSIISVGEVGEHPSLLKRLIDNRMEPFCPEVVQNNRRQDNEPAYFPYGVAYISKTDALIEQNTFYTARCTYYVIKDYQKVEVDDIYDFLCAESIMKHEWGLK